MELVCVGNLPLNTCWCLSSLLGRKDPEGAMVGRAGAVVQGYLGLPVHSCTQVPHRLIFPTSDRHSRQG